jgi:hypothetical protein
MRLRMRLNYPQLMIIEDVLRILRVSECKLRMGGSSSVILNYPQLMIIEDVLGILRVSECKLRMGGSSSIIPN